MARPRYAEMLVDRRRQLGLSITQASQVLRLKEARRGPHLREVLLGFRLSPL